LIFVIVGFAVASFVTIFSKVNYPPPVWRGYLVMPVAGGAGSVMGGVLTSRASSDPMPGAALVAIAGALFFCGVAAAARAASGKLGR